MAHVDEVSTVSSTNKESTVSGISNQELLIPVEDIKDEDLERELTEAQYNMTNLRDDAKEAIEEASEERENLKYANKEVKKNEKNRTGGRCGKCCTEARRQRKREEYDKAASDAEKIIYKEAAALWKANTKLAAHKEAVDRWKELSLRLLNMKYKPPLSKQTPEASSQNKDSEPFSPIGSLYSEPPLPSDVKESATKPEKYISSEYFFRR